MLITKTSVEEVLLQQISEKIYDVLNEYLSERLSNDISLKMDEEIEELTHAFILKYAMNDDELGIE